MAGTCVKTIVRWGAKVMVLIGLATLGFGFYTLWQATHGSYKDLYFDDSDWLKNLQEYGVILLGIALIFFGVCGSYGAAAKKKRIFLLLIYDLGALIMSLAFLGLAGFVYFKARKLFNEDDGPTGNGDKYMTQVNDGVAAAQLIFCQARCPCYIKDYPGKYPLGLQTTDVNTQTDFGKCKDFDNSYAAAAQLMAAAEEIFSCSGWQNNNGIYLFSDVNRGIPDNQTCFKALGDFFNSKGELFAYVFGAIGLLFGLNVLLSFIICCQSDKRKTGNFYQKMGYYDDD